MRVLHIYSGDVFGGIETYLITLARFCSPGSGMQPEFGLCYPGRLSQELQKQDAIIHWLGGVRMRYPWTLLSARRRLRKILQDNAYDVVVCHSIWPQANFAAVVRDAGLPLVFYQHNILASGGRHWLERWAGRVPPDRAICNSRYTQSDLVKLYPGVDSQVVYFPVSPPERFSAEERTATRQELQTPAEATVIIQVSRMEAWKGQGLHLEALAQLARIPDWVAWFVGGPQRPAERQYFANLQAQAARLGISDRVRFLAQRQDVPRLLAAADIFCQPNSGSPEPFGIVFVEALGAGLPVVSTAMGGTLEIVDESCGILVPPENIASLAHALEQLLLDQDLRMRLADRASARAHALCAPERQMRMLEQTLSAVCRPRPGQSVGPAANPERSMQVRDSTSGVS